MKPGTMLSAWWYASTACSGMLPFARVAPNRFHSLASYQTNVGNCTNYFITTRISCSKKSIIAHVRFDAQCGSETVGGLLEFTGKIKEHTQAALHLVINILWIPLRRFNVQLLNRLVVTSVNVNHVIAVTSRTHDFKFRILHNGNECNVNTKVTKVMCQKIVTQIESTLKSQR